MIALLVVVLHVVYLEGETRYAKCVSRSRLQLRKVEGLSEVESVHVFGKVVWHEMEQYAGAWTS